MVVESTASDEDPVPGLEWTAVDGVVTVATGTTAGISHTLDYDDLADTLVLLGQDGTIESVSLAGIVSVQIFGAADTDWLAFAGSALLPIPVLFDGGDGEDTLRGPSSTTRRPRAAGWARWRSRST